MWTAQLGSRGFRKFEDSENDASLGHRRPNLSRFRNYARSPSALYSANQRNRRLCCQSSWHRRSTLCALRTLGSPLSDQPGSIVIVRWPAGMPTSHFEGRQLDEPSQGPADTEGLLHDRGRTLRDIGEFAVDRRDAGLAEGKQPPRTPDPPQDRPNARNNKPKRGGYGVTTRNLDTS